MFHEIDQLRDELIAAYRGLEFDDFQISAGYSVEGELYRVNIRVWVRRPGVHHWTTIEAAHSATSETVHRASMGLLAVETIVNRSAMAQLRQDLHRFAAAFPHSSEPGLIDCELCRTNGLSSTCPQCYGRGKVKVSGE